MAPTLVLLAALVAAAIAAPERAAAPPAAGNVAPAFEAADLSGRKWSAADLRGRVVLIDFWATWCAPCLAELPRLKTLRQRHARSDFEILGVSLDVSSRQSFVSWINRNRIEWPQVHEKAGYSATLARLFEVDRLPRTVLLDRDGTIAALDLRGDRLAAEIDRLVARPEERR